MVLAELTAHQMRLNSGPNSKDAPSIGLNPLLFAEDKQEFTGGSLEAYSSN